MSSNVDAGGVHEQVLAILRTVFHIEQLSANIATREPVDFKAAIRQAVRDGTFEQPDVEAARGKVPDDPLGRYAAPGGFREHFKKYGELVDKAEHEAWSRHLDKLHDLKSKRMALEQELLRTLGRLADDASPVHRSESLEVLCQASERSPWLRLTLARAISSAGKVTNFARAFASLPRLARACRAELLLQLDGSKELPWLGGLFPGTAPARYREVDFRPDTERQLAAIEALSGLVGESSELDERIAAKLKCDLGVFPCSSYVRTFGRLAKENRAIAELLMARAKSWDLGMRGAAKKALDVAIGRM